MTSEDAVSCASDKRLETSCRQWRPLILTLLSVLFSSLAVALLFLYLQATSHLRLGQEEAEALRLNRSRWIDELALARQDGFSLQTNLSSLMQELDTLQNILLPQLLHNRTRHQLELKAIQRHRVDLHRNFSILQEDYKILREKNVLIPWSSALLENCLPTDPVVCPVCRPGWRNLELSCYLQPEGTGSWEESASWCRMEGGYLAVVSDANEQHFLRDMVSETTWIGLSDHLREGYWRWVDGAPYEPTASLWHLEQPDNDGDEDCVTLSPASGWNDEKCDKKYRRVCERRADQLIVRGDTISN